MRVLQRPSLRSLAWLSGIGLLVGCTGETAMVGPRPPATYTASRTAEGRACTFLVLGVIPIAVNGRAQRAYDEALHTTGGVGLLDVKVTERWYYAVVGNIYCTDIEGLGYTSGNGSIGRVGASGHYPGRLPPETSLFTGPSSKQP